MRWIQVLLVVASATASGIVNAQFFEDEPDVSREFLDQVRQLEGDLIRFCVYDASVTAPFDRAVARAIGDVLLVDVEFVSITSAIQIEGLDFVPISADEFYIHLQNDCQAFLGMALSADVYPDWLTFTRPYGAAPFVAVAHQDSDIEAVHDVERGERIGTAMLSEIDIRLISYNGSLPEGRRWQRTPYSHNGRVLERVLDGSVDIGLLWHPAYEYLVRSNDAFDGAKIVSLDPLPGAVRRMGMALRSNDSFVRSLLDDAIEVIVNEGVVQELYQQSDFPGVAP